MGDFLLSNLAMLKNVIVVVTCSPFQVQQKLHAVRGKFRQLMASLGSKWEKVGAQPQTSHPHPVNYFLVHAFPVDIQLLLHGQVQGVQWTCFLSRK